MPHRKRFVVGYSRPCGNTWNVACFDRLGAALRAEEGIRDLHAEEGKTSAVYTYDSNNEERGAMGELDLVENGGDFD